MGLNVTGDVTVWKDEKGVCKINITRKENVDGEEKTLFHRINVGFRKGIEIKNKTRIRITNGFLTFFTIQITNEKQEVENKNFLKLVVLDFEVLEEGIDEPYSFERKPKQGASEGNVNFLDADDELPF